MRLIAALAAEIFVADQNTKLLALTRLRTGVPVPVVEGVFSLTLVMNHGLAFGMLGDIPESLRWMVGLLSLGALVLLAVLAARVLPSGGRWARLALGLVVGGAAGNLVDSPFGRAMRALHSAEPGARAVGVDPAGVKASIFVLSAVGASLMGSLTAHYVGFVTPQVAKDLDAAIKKAGKQVETHIYPGVDHAFFNDENATAYNKPAADDAWRRTLAFFRQNLK